MKKIVISFALILSISFINAQEIIIKKGEHIKEIVKGAHYKFPKDGSEKFEGVWEYRNGNQTFKIQFKTEEFYLESFDIYVDHLYGIYCITEDGIDCLLDNQKNRMSTESSRTEIGQGLSFFLFLDTEYEKTGKAKVVILENGTAKWTLRNREMVHGKDWKDGFSVPTDVILTKVQ